MKSTIIIKSLAVLALMAGLGVSSASAEDTAKKDNAQLLAQAQVSKQDAQKTALTKAPMGTVKEGELEMEKGLLIWSFDISTPNSKDITEVAVDAKTGKIVSVDTEKPKDQAKEAAADAKEGK